MFRLDNLLERWTTIYDPMQHNPSATAKPEEKAFFRIDRMELENGFTRVFNLLKKPCICACVNFDARLNEKRPRLAVYHHQLYLCQKQPTGPNQMQDDLGAADTKCDLNEMVLDLLAFLFALQDLLGGKSAPKDFPPSALSLYHQLDEETRLGIRGLQMNDTEWWSTPRYKNGWWIIGVELYGLDTTQLCVKPSRYI